MPSFAALMTVLKSNFGRHQTMLQKRTIGPCDLPFLGTTVFNHCMRSEGLTLTWYNSYLTCERPLNGRACRLSKGCGFAGQYKAIHEDELGLEADPVLLEITKCGHVFELTWSGDDTELFTGVGFEYERSLVAAWTTVANALVVKNAI